jgi:hypothetical protein
MHYTQPLWKRNKPFQGGCPSLATINEFSLASCRLKENGLEESMHGNTMVQVLTSDEDSILAVTIHASAPFRGFGPSCVMGFSLKC